MKEHFVGLFHLYLRPCPDKAPADYWLGPSFLTLRIQEARPWQHIGVGLSTTSPHCQNEQGLFRSEHTKKGLPPLPLLLSFTPRILADLWWVWQTVWGQPLAWKEAMALAKMSQSFCGQNNWQLGLLPQYQNRPYFVVVVNAGLPCRHSMRMILLWQRTEFEWNRMKRYFFYNNPGSKTR